MTEKDRKKLEMVLCVVYPASTEELEREVTDEDVRNMIKVVNETLPVVERDKDLMDNLLAFFRDIEANNGASDNAVRAFQGTKGRLRGVLQDMREKMNL